MTATKNKQTDDSTHWPSDRSEQLERIYQSILRAEKAFMNPYANNYPNEIETVTYQITRLLSDDQIAILYEAVKSLNKVGFNSSFEDPS